MAAHSETLTKPIKATAKEKENVPEAVGQSRPKSERYQLQVDRQMKASFTTLAAAESAGQAIKKAHPIVQVTVYDAVESKNTIIEGSKIK